MKLTNDKYVSLKDINIKLEAELRLQSNKLIELASYADELEKQNAKMKSESISNPILEKLNRDPELLIKVVSEIEFSRGRESNNPNIDKTENYNKIVL